MLMKKWMNKMKWMKIKKIMIKKNMTKNNNKKKWMNKMKNKLMMIKIQNSMNKVNKAHKLNNQLILILVLNLDQVILCLILRSEKEDLL